MTACRLHATCRLQINGDFTLDDARAALPHLHALGVSHLYLSPIFETRPGSMHGYDVTDPTRVRAAIGGEDALRELAAAARTAGMGILLDIVPNHMAASPENPWWRDLLRNGPDSPFADWFDIAWGTGDAWPMVLPVLGLPLPDAIAAGDVRLDWTGAEPEIVVYENRYPVAPGSASPSDLAYEEAERLRRVLGRQHFRLAQWSAATRILAYRRFFDVGDLVAFRVEVDAAFRAMHAAVERWVAEGLIDGVRIDHIDGLADPGRYLTCLAGHLRTPGGEPVVLLVEKILDRTEQLPGEWPVDGTTGYELIDRITGLLTDAAGWERLRAHHVHFVSRDTSFADVAREARLRVIDRLFPAELSALANALDERLGPNSPGAHELRAALRSVCVGLRVYRTYVRDRVRPDDRARIEEAVRDAASHDDVAEGVLDLVRTVLLLEHPSGVDLDRFVRQWQQFTGPVMAKGFEDTALYNWAVMSAANEVGGGPGEPHIPAQQVHTFLADRSVHGSGSLNATSTHDTKRGEDVRARLLALTEFAGEWTSAVEQWLDASARMSPVVATVDRDDVLLIAQAIAGAWPLDGRADAAFHERLRSYATKAVREAKRQTSWREPDATYEAAVATLVDAFIDTQVGGAVPALRALLPRLEIAGAVNALAQVLLRSAAPGVPDLYQGNETWRFDLVDPDNRRPVDLAALDRLRASLDAWIEHPVPDVAALLDRWRDGALKVFVTAATLRFRRAHPELLAGGRYLPLDSGGEAADRIFGFLRGPTGDGCLAALPRMSATLAPGAWPLGHVWNDTALLLPDGAPAQWRSVLTGRTTRAVNGRLEAAGLFEHLPVALLEPA